jgi:hypothetical protein
MGLRGKLRRLERNANEDLASFILENGSRYYFNPTSAEVFLHSMDCLRAQGDCEPFPEPPETVKSIARARDRRGASISCTRAVRSASSLTRRRLS